MRLLYLHGLRSLPGGQKPTYLKAQGFEVLNPHLPDADFAESVRRARAAFDAGRPSVVVGSSRGGAVALAIETGPTPVILIAPAWRRWGDPASARARPTTVILHAEADAVIPLADSLELIARSGLPDSRLRVVGADHNMTDPAALDALVAAIRLAGGREGGASVDLKGSGRPV